MPDTRRLAARAGQLSLQAAEAPFRGAVIGGLVAGGLAVLIFARTYPWIALVIGLCGAGIGLFFGIQRRRRLLRQESQVLATLAKADLQSSSNE
ncbi:MAG TPA: hypothetical protein PLN52_02560 [Opitutaceae bacterium]|nr:hypothetical protein [Opitutaceae bacterium]